MAGFIIIATQACTVITCFFIKQMNHEWHMWRIDYIKTSKGQRMDNIDRRMELIRMMRTEHEENIGRIRKREHILYPNNRLSYSDLLNKKSYGYPEADLPKENGDSTSQHKGNWSFYMRLGVCMGLFLLFVYMETQNISYLGITHKQIQNLLSETIDVNSFAFMEQFPYTLEE